MDLEYNSTDNINDLIARYFAKELDRVETEELLKWIKKSPQNRQYFFRQQDIWEAIHPAFPSHCIDSDRAERRVLSRAGIHSRRRSWISNFLRICGGVAAAAVISIVSIAIYSYLYSNGSASGNIPVEISTSYGCTSRSTLPDGSEVWLNANSTISYLPGMQSGRIVRLRGEAFFEVKSDPADPFTVVANGTSITATGTRFNVNAYTHDPAVTLVNGKVDVTTGGNEIVMAPGQHLCFDCGKPVLSQATDIDHFCSWRDGVLIFDNNSLTDICTRLSHIYNVQFDIDPRLSQSKYHITIKQDNISEIIEMLQLIAPITCATSVDVNQADGSRIDIVRISPRN